MVFANKLLMLLNLVLFEQAFSKSLNLLILVNSLVQECSYCLESNYIRYLNALPIVRLLVTESSNKLTNNVYLALV
jgi:hypothetical protein